MINDAGVPLIMDQGLTLFISRAEFMITNSCSSCRWIAPEILEPAKADDIAPEKEPFFEDPEYHDYDTVHTNERRLLSWYDYSQGDDRGSSVQLFAI